MYDNRDKIGYWETDINNNKMRCSLCKCEPTSGTKTDYCDHCGCKMVAMQRRSHFSIDNLFGKLAMGY